MRIIERFTQGKHRDPSLNEDGMIITGGAGMTGDGFVAVVDGVTSKSTRHPWHPSGGVVARRLCLEAIASLPADATMRGAQHAIDTCLHDAYGTHPAGSAFFEANPVERLQANAVVYSARRHEAWLFGDCQIMVNGTQIPTVKPVDELLGALRSFAAEALELRREREGDGGTEGATGTEADADQARAMIMPFLRLQSELANRRGRYGYFVFDGFTDPTYPIRTVAIHPGDEVVLASDGYPILRPTLAQSERELARLKREDPLLIHEFPTTKGFSADLDSFDDRTYVRFIA